MATKKRGEFMKEQKQARYLIYVFKDGFEIKAPVFGMSGKRQWHLSRAHCGLSHIRVGY